MSLRHTLKSHPEPFAAVWNSIKTYEIRKSDRPFEVGDSLQLSEWLPEEEQFTGRVIGATVVHLTQGPDWGLPLDLCVLGISVFAREVMK